MKQPEAIQLANEMRENGCCHVRKEAEAELRRLAEVEKERDRLLADVERLHHMIQGEFGYSDAVIKAQTEISKLHEANQAMLDAMKEAKEALRFANESPNGPINDTIWMMHRPETLFDFLDAAIAKGEQQ